MPIETAQKRFSMMNIGGGPGFHTLPVANGEIDSYDRLHLLGLYSLHGPIAREATLGVAAVATLAPSYTAELSRADIADYIIQ